jgi:hypothetical protein
MPVAMLPRMRGLSNASVTASAAIKVVNLIANSPRVVYDVFLCFFPR